MAAPYDTDDLYYHSRFLTPERASSDYGGHAYYRNDVYPNYKRKLKYFPTPSHKDILGHPKNILGSSQPDLVANHRSSSDHQPTYVNHRDYDSYYGNRDLYNRLNFPDDPLKERLYNYNGVVVRRNNNLQRSLSVNDIDRELEMRRQNDFINTYNESLSGLPRQTARSLTSFQQEAVIETCERCGYDVLPGDQFRVGNSTWHTWCMKCSNCSVRLKTVADIYVFKGAFYCINCYNEIQVSLNHHSLSPYVHPTSTYYNTLKDRQLRLRHLDDEYNIWRESFTNLPFEENLYANQQQVLKHLHSVHDNPRPYHQGVFNLTPDRNYENLETIQRFTRRKKNGHTQPPKPHRSILKNDGLNYLKRAFMRPFKRPRSEAYLREIEDPTYMNAKDATIAQLHEDSLLSDEDPDYEVIPPRPYLPPALLDSPRNVFAKPPPPPRILRKAYSTPSVNIHAERYARVPSYHEYRASHIIREEEIALRRLQSIKEDYYGRLGRNKPSLDPQAFRKRPPPLPITRRRSQPGVNFEEVGSLTSNNTEVTNLSSNGTNSPQDFVKPPPLRKPVEFIENKATLSEIEQRRNEILSRNHTEREHKQIQKEIQNLQQNEFEIRRNEIFRKNEAKRQKVELERQAELEETKNERRRLKELEEKRLEVFMKNNREKYDKRRMEIIRQNTREQHLGLVEAHYENSRQQQHNKKPFNDLKTSFSAIENRKSSIAEVEEPPPDTSSGILLESLNKDFGRMKLANHHTQDNLEVVVTPKTDEVVIVNDQPPATNNNVGFSRNRFNPSDDNKARREQVVPKHKKKQVKTIAKVSVKNNNKSDPDMPKMAGFVISNKNRFYNNNKK